MNNKNRKLGCFKSKTDVRDYQYCNVRNTNNQLPKKFLLKTLPVRDQGNAGTCVGMSLGIIQEADAMVRYNKEANRLSPLYIYSEAKAVDGLKGEGTDIKTALSVLTKKGICEETLYPYSDSDDIINLNFPKKTTKATSNAELYKTVGYAQINTIQELKTAIYNDNGAVLGVLVTESFYETGKDGVIDIPNGVIYGMHAIPAIGWDDNKVMTVNGTTYTGCIIIQNSWGLEWGDKGIGYIPYDVYNWKSVDGFWSFVTDAWTSYDLTNDNSNVNYHKDLQEQEKTEIKLTIGSKTAYVNGEPKELLQAPVAINGTTMVPVRFISEAFGYNVGWNQTTKTVTITE